MGLRQLRCAVAGFARGAQRILRPVQSEQRDRRVQKRRRIIRQQLLRRHETLQRLLVMAGALQRDAEIKLGLSVVWIGGDGASEQFGGLRKIIRLQPREACGAQRVDRFRIRLGHRRNG